MSASANKIAVVALILGLSTAIVHADSPPKLDVGPTCNAAAPYAIAVGRTKEACLADEDAAESTHAENWSKYSAADKTQCIGTANLAGRQVMWNCCPASRSCETQAAPTSLG
jgi:hypothetical protein